MTHSRNSSEIIRASNQPIGPKLCFSVAEAAELLGVCRNHLYTYIDSGQLASFKMKSRRLINRESLDSFRRSLEKKHTEKMKGQSA